MHYLIGLGILAGLVWFAFGAGAARAIVGVALLAVAAFFALVAAMVIWPEGPPGSPAEKVAALWPTFWHTLVFVASASLFHSFLATLRKRDRAADFARRLDKAEGPWPMAAPSDQRRPPATLLIPPLLIFGMIAALACALYWGS